MSAVKRKVVLDRMVVDWEFTPCRFAVCGTFEPTDSPYPTKDELSAGMHYLRRAGGIHNTEGGQRTVTNFIGAV